MVLFQGFLNQGQNYFSFFILGTVLEEFLENLHMSKRLQNILTKLLAVLEVISHLDEPVVHPFSGRRFHPDDHGHEVSE